MTVNVIVCGDTMIPSILALTNVHIVQYIEKQLHIMSKQEINIGDLVSLPVYMDDLTYTVLEKRYDEKLGVMLYRLDDSIWYEEKYLMKQ